VIPDRRAARDPAVARIIGEAEVVFISGGDQANYIRGWQDSVENAINAHIAAGKPVEARARGLRCSASSSTAVSTTNPMRMYSAGTRGRGHASGAMTGQRWSFGRSCNDETSTWSRTRGFGY